MSIFRTSHSNDRNRCSLRASIALTSGRRSSCKNSCPKLGSCRRQLRSISFKAAFRKKRCSPISRLPSMATGCRALELQEATASHHRLKLKEWPPSSPNMSSRATGRVSRAKWFTLSLGKEKPRSMAGLWGQSLCVEISGCSQSIYGHCSRRKRRHGSSVYTRTF